MQVKYVVVINYGQSQVPAAVLDTKQQALALILSWTAENVERANSNHWRIVEVPYQVKSDGMLGVTELEPDAQTTPPIDNASRCSSECTGGRCCEAS